MQEIPSALTWVPIGPHQSKEILRLVRDIEEHDGTPYRTSHEEILDYFDPTHFWRATAARDYSGRLIAFGLTRTPMAPGNNVEVTLSGGVHPEFRGAGVGRQLLRMQVVTAEQLVQGETESALAIMHVDAGQEDVEDLLERAGFTAASSYVQMRRELGGFTGASELPTFVSIEPLTADIRDEVRKAHNDIYFEQFGQAPLSGAQWALEHQYTHLPWSFVAVDRRGDRPRVAGYVLSGRYEQDWESRGWSEGYIQEVAVVKEWRGMNIMRSLLGAAMGAYEDDGIEFAGLDADVEIDGSNCTSVIFARFGFEKTGITTIFARPLQMRASSLRRVLRKDQPTE